MTDVHEPQVRSYNMSRIRARDTKPEMVVRRFLFSRGFRYRLHARELPGKPDVVLTKWKTVIFVHGCFWHGHRDCRYFVVPKTRTDWWLKKIESNRKRDQENLSKLRQDSWKVLTIFECSLRKARVDKTLDTLIKRITTNRVRRRK